jgi:hypothetical protein
MTIMPLSNSFIGELPDFVKINGEKVMVVLPDDKDSVLTESVCKDCGKICRIFSISFHPKGRATNFLENGWGRKITDKELSLESPPNCTFSMGKGRYFPNGEINGIAISFMQA